MEMDPEANLKLKVRLLTQGATLPEGYDSVRKGGAGPVGARYFILPNGKPCGIPIRKGETAEQFGSASLEPLNEDGLWLYDSEIELQEVVKPTFYDLEVDEGIPYWKIALLHGSSCLATTVYQKCRYWSQGTQCKFCTIPTSLQMGTTILEKEPAQVAEVVIAGEKDGLIEHVLLTTGTPEGSDAGGKRMVAISREIRRVSNLPIAVQLEPPRELSILDELSDAGVNSVGIHLETADDNIRKRVCPGKYDYASVEEYERIWEKAVEIFGRGEVSTFLLHGLGERTDETLRYIRHLAEIGVTTIVAPIRPAPGSQIPNFIPSYVGELGASIAFYKIAGKILLENNLNPNRVSAGCSKCGACTPIQEAYDWAESVMQ